MADEEKKNWLGPYIPQGNFIRELVQQLKLAYNLMLDPRVNPVTKLIPVAALVYLISPVDIAPDVMPLLGQLDDLGVVLLGLRMFFEFSPPEVVREHLKRLTENIREGWEVTRNPPPSSPPPQLPGDHDSSQ
jgi:uncharacterized membrane protein YkvA (DUF1232 family)